MKDLSEIRCDIDAIDRQIVSLYEQRMGLATEVAGIRLQIIKMFMIRRGKMKN